MYFLVKQQLELLERHIAQNTACQAPTPACVDIPLTLELDTVGYKILPQQPLEDFGVTVCGRDLLSG